MKHFYYLLLMLVASIASNAQNVALPDGAFKSFLINKYPGCFVASGGDQLLNTNCTAITTEDSLEFHNLTTPGEYIELEGIQYFTSLRYLNCSYNSIMASPALPAGLLYLDISHNYFNEPVNTFLPPLPAKLRYLNCSFNSLAITPASWPDSLHYLDCSNNNYGNPDVIPTPIPALPSHLDTLMCQNQGQYYFANHWLDVLPALPSTLKYLDCSKNRFSTLPAFPAGLLYLNCSDNNYNTNPETTVRTLATLPALPAGLKYLDCSFNKLTALPALPSTLTQLRCADNRGYSNDQQTLVYDGISALPSLPASLKYLDCSDNKLTALPTLPVSLDSLNCSNNIYVPDGQTFIGGITALPALPPSLKFLNTVGTGISCIPRIPASLVRLDIDRSKVHCLPNSGTYTVFPAGAALPLCSVINNVNDCQTTGIISGHVFYDINSNSIKDAGENYRANVEVQLSNGLHAYTGNDGYYELSADPGNYVLTIISPALYNAVPGTINYTIATYQDLVHALIALQPTVSVDSAALSLTSNNIPVPGFDYTYDVNFENVGTTLINPTIVLNYDPSKLTYLSSPNPGVINNGSQLTYSQPAVSPGQVNKFSAKFHVSQMLLLGDTIRAKAVLTAGSINVSDSMYGVVRSSYDPNDKRATPKLTVAQVSAGTYIDYMVRFQNTGTANAVNIVVTDTLNASLNAASFKMISVSHTCRVVRDGNKLSFQFYNILLPDSNANEPGSHGYIRFFVKPVTSLPANSVVPNKASIYFDFNVPVITNNALTTIEQNTLPLTLLSFRAVNDGSNKALLYWSTANEINTRSFEILQSADGRTFVNAGFVQARGSGDGSYNYGTTLIADVVWYRLKMMDNDGTVSYSPVAIVKRKSIPQKILVLTNPAKNSLLLLATDPALKGKEAAMINGLGQLVKRFVLSGTVQTLDVSGFAPGTYYLRAGGKTVLVVVNLPGL